MNDQQVKWMYFSFLKHSTEEESTFRDLFEHGFKNRMDSLSKYIVDYQSRHPGGDTEHFADDFYMLEKGLVQAHSLYVIGLSMDLEIFLKAVLRHIYEFESEQSFQFKRMLRDFKKAAGINLKSLAKFREINELREVANCAKHSGYVDDRLCRIDRSKWKLHSKLEVTSHQLDTYELAIREFKAAILSVVDSYITSFSGTPTKRVGWLRSLFLKLKKVIRLT